MSAPIADVLEILRRAGVAKLEFFPEVPNKATVIAQLSTPEQTGNTDAQAAKRDIFDVLADGVIPGAPRPDGFPPDVE